MSTVRRLAPAWLERVALGLLVAYFVLHAFVPAWQRLNSDFSNYYVAARLFRGGYPLDRIYEWVWFQRQKDHAGVDWGIVSYGPITPFSALILAPVASLSALAAKRCWLVVNLLLLGGVILLLRRMVHLPLRRVALVVFLTVVPLRTNFEFGQQHLLILFLLTLAGWLYGRGDRVPAAVIVAVAAVLKLYPALFVAFFALRRRWNALVGFLVTVVVSVGAGALLLGFEPLRVYATSVLPRISAGEVNDPYTIANNSPTVLLRRLFVAEPQLNPHPLAHVPAAYVVLQPAVQALLFVSAMWVFLRRSHDNAKELSLWGAFGALSLVVSTGSATYHFCTLILATVLAVDALVDAGRDKLALALVLLHALVCAPLQRFAPLSPSGWAIFLGVPRLYALLVYWGVFLFALTAVSPAPRRRLWELPAVLAAFAMMTLVGIASTERHFDGLFESYASRVPMKTEALVETAPTVASDGIYFSRMEDERYVLDRTGAELAEAAPTFTDLFHPTIAAFRDEGWVEVVDRRSRIDRFSRHAAGISAVELPIEVDDAEDPAVSPDGRWLGFLREDQGRGSLWMSDRGVSGGPSSKPSMPRQVVDATHDVMDFSLFPDGRIVFAARSDGGSASLFLVDQVGTTITSLGTLGRYPAVSPNGERLAYSQRERGMWQLRMMDLATGESRRLTHADCNSMSPAWALDGKSIVYASDCGRGIGTTALCQLYVPEHFAKSE